MKNELLRLEKISYSIENICALNNVSLRIFENEIFCILGLNNSGKSYLANYISGALSINSGKVFFKEASITPVQQLTAISKDIFLINADTRAPANATFSEYLYILSGKQAPFFYNKKSTNNIARNLLDSMEIGIDPERIIDSFSLCWQHILMILGAYFSRKKLIILDCITDGYSSTDIDLLKYTLNKAKNNGVSILFFTRQYDIARIFGERVALMKKGEIVKVLASLDTYDKRTVYSSLSEKNDFSFCHSHIIDKNISVTISNIIPAYDISSHRGEIVGIIDGTKSITANVTRLLDDSRLAIPIKGMISNEHFEFSNIAEAKKKKIGIIFDSYRDSATFNNLSYQDNLSILKMDKLCNKYSRLFSSKYQKVLLEDLNLSDDHGSSGLFTNSLPFSHYTARQIALKKWLVFQPALLICLNPFSHLDFQNKAFFCEILDDIAQKGACVLIISDDFSIINSIFDQIIYTDRSQTVSYEVTEKTELWHIRSSIQNIITDSK